MLEVVSGLFIASYDEVLSYNGNAFIINLSNRQISDAVNVSMNDTEDEVPDLLHLTIYIIDLIKHYIQTTPVICACNQGINRSAYVIASYLIVHCNVAPVEAIAKIKLINRQMGRNALTNRMFLHNLNLLS